MDQIDLEELIQKIPGKEVTKIRCVAEYLSGRRETFTATLLKSGKAPKAFIKKVNDLKKFPTVLRVYTQKV